MRSKSKNTTNSILRLFELIGKPSLFLCKILILGLSEYLRLLKLFIQQLVSFLAQLRLPKLSIQLPKFSSRFAKPRRLSKQSRPQLKRQALVHSSHPRSLTLFLVSSLSIIIVSLLTYRYLLSDLPSITSLSSSPPSLTTKIYDRHGEILYQIYKDENRSLVTLASLPPHVIDATLAAEDKNFYSHYGVDFLGITRAALNNLRCRIYSLTCPLQGGSTITQQLVKNTLLTPEKTFIRKLKELILSVQIEMAYSKDQILEMYLNQVGYGGTAYGIEEAAHQYFGKSSRDLNLSESAMLAGLPISPTTLSPFGANPYLGKIRQRQVLESMVAAHKITEDDKVQALANPLVFNPQGITIRAPHFVMYVKDLLVKEFGEEAVARGGLEVTTTLDLSTQNLLQSQINLELENLKKLHVQNGAGLVVNPQTGEVLAMVGSKDFFNVAEDGQVNLVMQERQPGSSIKPITYALALSQGSTPNSTIDDAPICFMIKGQPDYCPKNYDNKFHGKVTLRTALANSYNIPAIKLLNHYGLDNMISLARQLGITTWDDSSRFGLSLTLGGGEITMYDLASVYSVFANGGTKVPFNPILSIKDSSGKLLTLKNQTNQTHEVLSPAVAYQINSILSDHAARSAAFGTNSILNLPGKNVAVKTGTTNDLRDNWTFGYTSDLLIATWVGNNDNTSMSSVASGVTGASPIWARTMKTMLNGQDSSPFSLPQSITPVNLSCHNPPKYEYFVQGTAPKIDCKNQAGLILPAAASTSQ
jgi:1A family penicillin-binding protein